MEFVEMFEGLSSEQRGKLLACKDADEVIAFAKDEHVALPDELLSGVAGGTIDVSDPKTFICPKCGYKNDDYISTMIYSMSGRMYCNGCYKWWVPAE